MRRRLAALATGTLLLVALTMPGPANATGGGGGGPPAAGPLVPRIVATFSAGEGGSFAESMVADQKGNLFASVTDWMPEGASNVGQIWQISRDGVSPFGFRLDAGGGLLTGVAFDDEGQLYVGDATFGYGLAPGVFRVTAGAPPTRVLSLPDFAFPNGLAFHAGYLFVSDSNGAIWRVRPRVDAVAPPSPWIEDPLLRPVAGWEGVNGIAFLGNDLYAVNADTGTVIRVPVLRDGSPGSPLVVASDSALVTADGVAFDDDGDFWIAVNHESGGALARVTRDGSVTVVVSDPGWLDYPSQPVFGQSGSARTTLYVENGSLSNGTPNVIALGVGVRGPRP
jgi:hypothetical protein